MVDIAFESLRALVLLGILVFFVRSDKVISHGRRGWLYIQIGFLFVLFGALLDVADNFSYFECTHLIFGVPLQLLLKKGVGYGGGTILLGIGFWLWLPSMQHVDDLRRELLDTKKSFDYKVMERTKTLEKEFDSRSKLEAALRQTEEHRKLLYENAPIGISHGLIGGTLVERNASFARMLGYDSPAELGAAIDASGDVAFFWHDKNEFKAMTDRLRKEELVSGCEVRFKRKDGSTAWVHLTFTTLKDRNGQNYYFYCFADDITDSKLAADALARSENRLKTIISFLPAGVILVDTATQSIMDINPAALKMLGYERDEVIGHHCCDTLCPRERGECPILDKGKEILNTMVKYRRKDGVEISVVKSAALLTMGGHEYLLETFVDMSEQKRLEDLKEDVDHIFKHDLKSPVVSMINACSVLLMEEGTPDETREMLELIRQQGNKVLRMAGMSLAIYKIEAGIYEYQPQVVDLVSLAGRVRVELAEKALNAQVSLNVELNGGEPGESDALRVSGDEMLCESLFANMLANAIEASPKNGTVTVSLENGDHPRVIFTNQGVVPAEIRENFFSKFATSRKKNGTGLGTYSAEISARAMGATIAMHTSDEENLTTVTVEFLSAAG